MRVPTSDEDEDESEIDVINNNYCNNVTSSRFFKKNYNSLMEIARFTNI